MHSLKVQKVHLSIDAYVDRVTVLPNKLKSYSTFAQT